MPNFTLDIEKASASIETFDENDAPQSGAKVEALDIESASTSIEKIYEINGPKYGQKVQRTTEAFGVQLVTPMHFCSMVLLALYLLLGTALVVILQIANERQDFELNQVRLNRVYYWAFAGCGEIWPHCSWIRANKIIATFQIGIFGVGLPAELCVLITIPMIQCVGDKYEGSRLCYLKYMVAGWIAFILGVSVDYNDFDRSKYHRRKQTVFFLCMCMNERTLLSRTHIH